MNQFYFSLGVRARAIKMGKAIKAAGFSVRIQDTNRTIMGGSHRYRVITYHPTMTQEEIGEKVHAIIKEI